LLLCVAAVGRTSRTRWVLVAGGVGVGVAIASAAILLTRACPGTGPCLL
jgi:hypothetical protein